MTDNEQKTRICTMCHKTKPVEEFRLFEDRYCVQRRRARCRQCESNVSKAYYAKNKLAIKIRTVQRAMARAG